LLCDQTFLILLQANKSRYNVEPHIKKSIISVLVQIHCKY